MNSIGLLVFVAWGVLVFGFILYWRAERYWMHRIDSQSESDNGSRYHIVVIDDSSEETDQ
jgi:hypothetical protein